MDKDLDIQIMMRLIELAKTAVEVAIEEDENKAINLLKQNKIINL